jgi:rhodanese-related sulfurtransferase
MSKVSAEYVKLKISDVKVKKFVVICHAGIRSYNFGQWSLDNNLVNEIWNLEEGIDGWSKYIDQTIPRY